MGVMNLPPALMAALAAKMGGGAGGPPGMAGPMSGGMGGPPPMAPPPSVLSLPPPLPSRKPKLKPVSVKKSKPGHMSPLVAQAFKAKAKRLGVF